jgi:hypothetical protein
MIDIMPAILETFTLTLVVTYIFGMMGNLLFREVLPEWRNPLISVIKAQQLTYMVNNIIVCVRSRSLIAWACQVDYLASMEAAMEVQNPFLVSAYFLFYLVISLAVSNIALSIIIDLHATASPRTSSSSPYST